jgi:chromosome segregation protein
MRLSKIKIAGFKSFVDPTTIHLQSNLTAIVGPNGCGKSNTIDAVRWVMGESSAKHLRGESMADVIFNGSSSRKPVGKASVELVFDNSGQLASKLGGQWAAYNEIAVKREVTRDGKGQYFLNGTKCRRRDITDIFLGTGLGPRSYAIIEQGTISRIIEAKPEELRVFLEEAAGISKYKERRRETENRIRHTRDNLDRLSNIRGELDKQLDRLRRQAATAERYKLLKADERRAKATLMGLRLQELIDQVANGESALRGRGNQVEAAMAAMRQLEASLEKDRQQQYHANEALNKAQANFYQVTSDIARLEGEIKHHQELNQRLQAELDQLQESLKQAIEHSARDEAKATAASRQLAELEPRLVDGLTAEKASANSVIDADQAVSAWQSRWDAHIQQSANPSRDADVARNNIRLIEREQAGRTQRQQRISTELASIKLVDIEQRITQLSTELDKATLQSTDVASKLSDINSDMASTKEQDKALTQQLHEARSTQQQLVGRISSLEALQQAALNRETGASKRWLRDSDLADNARLAQLINVEKGWETAVEKVLGHYLDALAVDSLADVVKLAVGQDKLSVSLVEIDNSKINEVKDGSAPCLLDKVSSTVPLASLIGHVLIADDMDQAEELRAVLEPHQFIVTKAGDLLGSHSFLRRGEDDQRAGVLSREQELRVLQVEQQENSDFVEQFQEQHNQQRQALQELEAQREQLQKQVNLQQHQVSQFSAKLESEQAAHQQSSARSESLSAELDSLAEQLVTDQATLLSTAANLKSAELAMSEAETTSKELRAERDQLQQALQQARQQRGRTRERVQALQLQVAGQQRERDNMQSNLSRQQQQLEQLRERERQTQATLAREDDPIGGRRATLNQRMWEREEGEKGLAAAREVLEQIDQRLRATDLERMKAEQILDSAREKHTQAKLLLQESSTRQQALREQILETGIAQGELLNAVAQEPKNLPTIDQAEATFKQCQMKIERLGPINLAAIDEFSQESERKDYLDAQDADLTLALETLEAAISKIDKETRTLFRETFDKVNAGIQDMFPRLFGGGEASLEMTGDDLLSAGVNVMARPPGKRNSSIHLLSGGEKALTAVALVFSIFQLNPAPFCMLDEVDAPLDDANVSRFSKLVSEMSATVQFIFITHNKVTMETAQQLAGVTMQEPGVSRLVSVDVDEAVRLAG